MRTAFVILLIAFALHGDAEAFSHGKAVNSGGFLLDGSMVILEDDSGGNLLAQ